MKKIFCLVCFFLALFSLKSIADVPEGAIPFVFDGHLYLQSTLNDTIPVTLIYDTGADFLYLDEDYLKLNHLQNAFGRKGKATMGGAGTHRHIHRSDYSPLRGEGIPKRDYTYN